MSLISLQPLHSTDRVRFHCIFTAVWSGDNVFKPFKLHIFVHFVNYHSPGVTQPRRFMQRYAGSPPKHSYLKHLKSLHDANMDVYRCETKKYTSQQLDQPVRVEINGFILLFHLAIPYFATKSCGWNKKYRKRQDSGRNGLQTSNHKLYEVILHVFLTLIFKIHRFDFSVFLPQGVESVVFLPLFGVILPFFCVTRTASLSNDWTG